MFNTGHRDDQRIDIRIRQGPAKRSLCKGITLRFERAHVVEPCAHQSFHRHHANVLGLRLGEQSGQFGLHLNKVERLGQALIKRRVLTKVVGGQNDIHQIVIDGVIQHFRESARMPGDACIRNLALLFGTAGKFIPLWIIESGLVVYGVIEVHLNVIGLQACKRCFELMHHGIALGRCAAKLFGGKYHFIALTL